MTNCIPNTYLNEHGWAGYTFNWTLNNGSSMSTSTLQNPSFALTEPGFYNVLQTITGPNYSDSKTVENAIYIYAPTQPACMPQSSYTSSFGYSINNVFFGSISNSSDVLTGGYDDFFCSQNTRLVATNSYPIAITARAGNASGTPEAMETYIDYNNNAVFDDTELVIAGTVTSGTTATFTENVVIPDTAVKNTLLRMRVIGDAGSITSAERNCGANYYIGDIEDYGVYITETLNTDSQQTTSVRYYPNPVKGLLQVEMPEAINKIQVFDIVGKLIHEIFPKVSSTDVDFSRYATGLYLVSLFSGSTKSTIKILKE
ncbi:MAG TPA: T9SS type A sorting domain-containing protein [Flavobacterium sp.]|jgi:PKD repeat protein